MMRKVILWVVLAVTASMMFATFAAFAAEEDLSGTYRLVSSTRKILDTGEVLNTYGEQPPLGEKQTLTVVFIGTSIA